MYSRLWPGINQLALMLYFSNNFRILRVPMLPARRPGSYQVSRYQHMGPCRYIITYQQIRLNVDQHQQDVVSLFARKPGKMRIDCTSTDITSTVLSLITPQPTRNSVNVDTITYQDAFLAHDDEG